MPRCLLWSGAAALLLGSQNVANPLPGQSPVVTLNRGLGLTVGGKRYVPTGKKDRHGNPIYKYAGPAPQARNQGRFAKVPPRRAKTAWDLRLEAARTKLQALPAADLSRVLASGDDAHVVATLERAQQLKTLLPVPVLAAAMGRVRGSKTAQTVAAYLSRHGTLSARETLALHVARGGPGASSIQKTLGAGGRAMVAAARVRLAERERWLNDAASGRPGSSGQLEAIGLLAEEPGREVAGLLRQLAGDRNEAVARAAARALARRQQAGL